MSDGFKEMLDVAIERNIQEIKQPIEVEIRRIFADSIKELNLVKKSDLENLIKDAFKKMLFEKRNEIIAIIKETLVKELMPQINTNEKVFSKPQEVREEKAERPGDNRGNLKATTPAPANRRVVPAQFSGNKGNDRFAYIPPERKETSVERFDNNIGNPKNPTQPSTTQEVGTAQFGGSRVSDRFAYIPPERKETTVDRIDDNISNKVITPKPTKSREIIKTDINDHKIKSEPKVTDINYSKPQNVNKAIPAFPNNTLVKEAITPKPPEVQNSDFNFSVNKVSEVTEPKPIKPVQEEIKVKNDLSFSFDKMPFALEVLPPVIAEDSQPNVLENFLAGKTFLSKNHQFRAIAFYLTTIAHKVHFNVKDIREAFEKANFEPHANFGITARDNVKSGFFEVIPEKKDGFVTWKITEKTMREFR
jgi:hypothetical protein